MYIYIYVYKHLYIIQVMRSDASSYVAERVRYTPIYLSIYLSIYLCP